MNISKTLKYLEYVPALCSQLVDLGLGDVSALLSLLHLMLHLPVPGQVSVGLLFLKDTTFKNWCLELPHKNRAVIISCCIMLTSSLVLEKVLLVWRMFVMHVLNIWHSQLPQPVACRISLSAAACPPDPEVGLRSSCPPQSRGGIQYNLFEINTTANTIIPSVSSASSKQLESTLIHSSSTGDPLQKELQKQGQANKLPVLKMWTCARQRRNFQICIYTTWHKVLRGSLCAVKTLPSLSSKLPVKNEFACKSCTHLHKDVAILI